ncbi:hypothetical protein RhiJN_23278 [Ceratobasidium sp. AG-Ba]|nr:hypothetical protein RhiJN_23278 [Ceratobasidium sp. AG-Ba]
MNVHSHPALATFDDMHRPNPLAGLGTRRPAPAAAAVLSAGDLAELSREEHRAKFKHTKLCSFYQKGQCTRTFDACAFLHTDDPEVIARLGGVPANAPNPHNRPANADPHVNPRVNSLQSGKPRPRFPPGSRIMGIGVSKRSKLGPGDATELETKRTVCRFFASGMCEYGKDCRFLHTVPEPQDRPEPSPKSNNTLCRNYPGCAYGDRCDFKHIDLNPSNPPDEFGSPFSNISALPPSVSARASPTVVSRGPSALAAEPVNAPAFTLGERLGLLGDRPGSSVVGERTSRRQELVRTASFGELPRRETGLLGGVGEERRGSLLSEGRAALTRNASYNGPESISAVPSPLMRSSSLNTTTERPSSAFGSLLGLGPASSLLGIGLNAFDRAHSSQPHTRTHTPIPRAPSPSPTHIGISSRIAPHPATVLAPSAGFGSSFGSNALGTSFGSTTAIGTNGIGGSGSGANTPSHPVIRTLPPPGNEYSGTGWRVASPLPPHISSELAPPGGSVPGSPLALAPGSPLANAFTNDGFFTPTAATSNGNPPAEEPVHEEPKFGMGLGLTGAGLHFESDGEDLLPTMSYEDFADGFATDAESRADPEEKERPRGYKTLPCKFFNPLLGRECPAGDACNFIHDKLFSTKFNPAATNGNSSGSSTGARRESISNPTHPLFRTRECKYWAAGRCNQGDECPFKHTYGDDVDHQFESTGSVDGGRENPYWRTRPCKWFQQGQCLRGDNCNYLHTLETTPVVCKFYPTPGCRNGADCPFVHADGDDSLWAEEPEQLHMNGNGLINTNGNGMHIEDEDSEDDVIFEPMRSAGAQSSGGLDMLLSGLALSGQAQAVHNQNGH